MKSQPMSGAHKRRFGLGRPFPCGNQRVRQESLLPERNVPMTSVHRGGVVVLLSTLTPFLRSTKAVDSGHPAVWLRASRLTADRSGSVEKAKAIFEFVRDDILYTPVVGLPASRVLENREGVCVSKTLLFVALCRAVGIPAGFVFQGIRGAMSAAGYLLHGLAAIYVDGGWVRMDPRGATFREVSFDVRRGSLLPEEEFTIVSYPGIYSDLPEEFAYALRQEAWEIAWPDTILTPPAVPYEW